MVIGLRMVGLRSSSVEAMNIRLSIALLNLAVAKALLIASIGLSSFFLVQAEAQTEDGSRGGRENLRAGSPQKTEIDFSELEGANRTSARFLRDYAREKFKNAPADRKEGESKRYAVILDLYIKARGYAILNKTFFWCAILFAIGVLVWPSLAIILKDFGRKFEFLKSAIVQTTVTGLAAIFFAFYSHYKSRQVFTENLMRYTVFTASVDTDKLIDTVIEEMARIDQGFSFTEHTLKEKE